MTPMFATESEYIAERGVRVAEVVDAHLARHVVTVEMVPEVGKPYGILGN